MRFLLPLLFIAYVHGKVPVKELFQGVERSLEKTERIQKIFEKIDFERFANLTKELESSGRKYKINRLGYIGYYQFGVQALEDLGYLKKGEYKRMKRSKLNQRTFIKKYAKWKNGLSLKKFLNHHQKEAYIKYVKRNFNFLKKERLLNEVMDHKVLRGILLASHLVGVGTVKKFLRGELPKGKTDGNGVNLLTYLNIGIKGSK